VNFQFFLLLFDFAALEFPKALRVLLSNPDSIQVKVKEKPCSC
jgi:hypothetical protein